MKFIGLSSSKPTSKLENMTKGISGTFKAGFKKICAFIRIIKVSLLLALIVVISLFFWQNAAMINVDMPFIDYEVSAPLLIWVILSYLIISVLKKIFFFLAK